MNDIQKAAIVKALATKSSFAVGREFGLDKVYGSVSSIRQCVLNIFKQVADNPEKYGVTNEVIALVQQAMKDRRKSPQRVTGQGTSLYHQAKAADAVNKDMKELIDHGSKKAWVLLNRKLDAALSSPAAFKRLSLKELGFIAGVSFDKRQMVRGEATEHIMLKAKISEDLSPTQKLQLILEMRESIATTDS